MFILKLAGKIVLLPVWIILTVIGIAVKILVQMYSIVRGIFGLLLVGLILGTAICYHDWVQVAALAISDIPRSLTPLLLVYLFSLAVTVCNLNSHSFSRLLR